MTKEKISYLKLVGFDSPEEAYKKVQEWTSDLNDKEHIIRSIIIEVHIAIEDYLKQATELLLEGYLFNDSDENLKIDKENLSSSFERVGFRELYKFIKPVLDSWKRARPELADIKEIDNLRNQVAHNKPIEKVVYRGRNPFRDDDSFAQFFFDSWALKKCIKDFVQHAIVDPRALNKRYYEEYRANLENK